MARILSVGQCAYDHGSLSRQLRKWLDAEIVAAATFRRALDLLRSERFDLVLINRVTDADGTPGVRLIDEIKADPSLAAVPVMLVSDHADAQADAQSRGAVAGFGKSSLHDEETRRQIADAIEQPSRPREGAATP